MAGRDEIKWDELLRRESFNCSYTAVQGPPLTQCYCSPCFLDFRTIQHRHERARRLDQIHDNGHGQSGSSFYNTNSPMGHHPGASSGSGIGIPTRRKHVNGSRKDSGGGQGSINSVTKVSSTLSPLNPRRGVGSSATGTHSGITSSVASPLMSNTGHMTAMSLGAPFASSIQPGMGTSGPLIVNRPKSPSGRAKTSSSSSYPTRRS